MNVIDDAPLRAALAEESPRWKFVSGTRYREMSRVFALQLVAIAAHREPGRVMDGQTLTDAFAAKLHPLLDGRPADDAEGNTREPEAQGGIGGWTHAAAAWILVLASRTPTVWDQIPAEERERADLIMQALGVAGHFTMGDGNECHILLDGLSAHDKSWNINITEGYVDVMAAAGQYFGAPALDAFFASFDFDSFVARLRAANLMNIVRCWTHRPGIAGLVMHGGRHELPPPKRPLDLGGIAGTALGVRRPFRFQGLPADDAWGLFLTQGYRQFAKCVRTRINVQTGEHTRLLQRATSAEVSPWEGRLGMCTEFEGTDWYGVRSCLQYAFEGTMIVIGTGASLRALGLWRDDDSGRELERRLAVGLADLQFKAREGYRGWAHGKEILEGGDMIEGHGAAHVFAMGTTWFALPAEQ